MNDQPTIFPTTKELGIILLRTGSMMQSTGACTARIRMTMNRIANTYGFTSDIFITHRALNLTVSDKKSDQTFSGIKRTSPLRVNFEVVSGINRLSWNIKENKYSIQNIEDELDRLSTIPEFPGILTLLLVSLAGSCFCGLADGSFQAMSVTFIATLFGFSIRKLSHKRNFNPYLCIFFASLGATLVAGMFRKMFPLSGFEPAFATSVLFLIPGVPFINSFTDFLDGNILNGILHLVNALLISFMIALGLTCSLLIYQL